MTRDTRCPDAAFISLTSVVCVRVTGRTLIREESGAGACRARGREGEFAYTMDNDGSVVSTRRLVMAADGETGKG